MGDGDADGQDPSDSGNFGASFGADGLGDSVGFGAGTFGGGFGTDTTSDTATGNFGASFDASGLGGVGFGAGTIGGGFGGLGDFGSFSGEFGGGFGIGSGLSSLDFSAFTDSSISQAAPPAPAVVIGFNGTPVSFAPALGGITSVPVGLDGFANVGQVANEGFGFNSAESAPVTATQSNTIGQTLTAIGSTILGILGIASGTPQGVIGGAMSVSNGFATFSNSLSSAPPSIGNVPGTSPGDGNPAPNVVVGGGLPFGYNATPTLSGSPVLGFNGGIANAPPATTGAGAGLATLGGGFNIRPNSRYGEVSPNTTEQPKNNGLLLLLLSGATLFFLS